MNFRSKIKSPKFRVINQKVIQSLPKNIPSFIYLRNNRFDGLDKGADGITKNAFIDSLRGSLIIPDSIWEYPFICCYTIEYYYFYT